MRSKASIKSINLPEAPRPATETVRDSRYYGSGNHTYKITKSVSPLDARNRAKESEICQVRVREKLRKWAIVEKMVKEGATVDEIATKTGYTEKSVYSVLKLMRQAGYDIPARKRGRKAKDDKGKL